MKAHISAHNKKILGNECQLTEECNCRPNGLSCPLNGQCLTKSIVYKATVTSNQPNLETKTYHGMTANEFKRRYYGHKHDMSHKEKYGTTLSRYIWRLKDIRSKLSIRRQENFKWKTKWEIKEKATAYQPGSIDCKLCTAEKYHILHVDDKISLNVRSELLSKCRHRAKWKLSKLLS